MSDVETRFHYNEADDSLTIETYQDVGPYLERNKRRFNDAPETGRYKNDFRHMAEIPNNIINKWFQEGLNIFDQNDWPKIRKKLQDPEYRYLRSTPGKL